jgi:hypothetical protein
MPARIVVLLALAGLAACTHSNGDEAETTTAMEPRAQSGAVRIAEQGASVDASYVVGDRLHGLTGSRRKLDAAINAAKIALLAPVAVPDPGGGVIAYNSWRGGRPVVRLHGLDGDADERVLDGAYSLAWRDDGAAAYFKGIPPRVDPANPRAYRGHVVVQSTADTNAERWTTKAGVYVVAAWAGNHLLAYEIGPSWPNLVVLDGPGRVRTLAEAGALVALSPDGRQAFVSTYGAEPPVVRVLDVASGRETASLTLDRSIRFVSEAGSWAGDLVAAKAAPGVVVFRVRPGRIAVEQVLRFEAGFPLGVFEPQLDDSGRRIVAWAELEPEPRQPLPTAVVLECDRLSLTCRQGRPVAAVLGPRLVYDPSRP